MFRPAREAAFRLSRPCTGRYPDGAADPAGRYATNNGGPLCVSF